VKATPLVLAAVASLGAVLLTVGVWTGPSPSVAFPASLTDPVALRTWIEGYGPWAPVVFVVLQAAQVVVAPVPGHVFGLVSGYLFGAVPGTVYSLLGAGIGTALAVLLARRLGRPFVRRMIPPDRLARYDDLAGRRGLTVLFVAFLIPGLPADALCLAAGLTPLPARQVVAVSVLARVPGYYLVNLAGAGAASGDYLGAGLLLGGLVTVAAVAVVGREWLFARLGA
jgi:uncharacterized membrane protein YdjX (TVP38/TMEM64 family)